MKTYNHIILTRVNIMRKDWTVDWLTDRIQLFKDFCYPSLNLQTNQNFKWLVFFDADTPDNIKNEINQSKKWKNFIPIYIQDNSENTILANIKEHIDPKAKYLITSRVDTDDGYAIDYVQRVQDLFHKYANSNERVIINFNKGFVLNKSTNKAYVRDHYINAFCSLIEPVKDFISVWVKNHRELGTICKVKKIDTNPMWLQVVHGSNLSNKVRRDSYRIPLKWLNNSNYICHNYNYDTVAENKFELFCDKLSTKFIYYIFIFLRPVKRNVENLFRRIILGKYKY